MKSRRTAVGVAAPLALLLACTGPQVPTPETVDEAVALAVPPIAPVVVDAVPDDAVVQQVVPDWDTEPSEGYDPLTSGATLYGLRSEDPLAGPLILVGSSSGSGSIGGPGWDMPGSHPVDLPAQEGEWQFVPAKDRSWVVHSVTGMDSITYVVGQQVSEDELLTAARSADFLGAPPTIAPGALPADFRPLVAGLPGDGPRPWQAQTTALFVDDVRIEISAVDAAQRLALLWGFWAVGEGAPLDDDLASEIGDDVTLLRAGPMPDTILADEVYGVVWASGGNVVSVVGSDWSMAERSAEDVGPLVESVAAQVRTGTPDQLRALAERVLDPPTPAQLYCPPDASIITGRTGDIRWSYAVGLDPDWGGFLHECAGVTNPVDGLSTQDRIWREGEDLPAVGQILAGPPNGSTTLDRPEHDGILRTGIAPAGTVRVVVVSQTGQEVEALVGGEGPREGERLFAAFFPGTAGVEASYLGAFGASAYDADGRGLDFQILP